MGLGQERSRIMSRAVWFVAFVIGAGLIVIVSPFEAQEDNYNFSPAFISQPQPGQATLEIFPQHGSTVELPFPAGLVGFSYGSIGDSIYAFQSSRQNSRKPGLYRIRLKPMHIEFVTGSTGLSGDVAVADSNGQAIVSGGYGATQDCGLFEIRIPEGTIRKIVGSSSCDYLALWSKPSISVDGKRLVAFRKPRLELIDIANGTIKSLGEDYFTASWSPDGKWLAALELGGNHRTVLMDSSTLAPMRSLEASTGQWSPDSRFLLALDSRFCSPYFSTMRMIEISTGKSIDVNSSKCKVNLRTAGWVKTNLVGH
jgi:WD40 repeat protein